MLSCNAPLQHSMKFGTVTALKGPLPTASSFAQLLMERRMIAQARASNICQRQDLLLRQQLMVVAQQPPLVADLPLPRLELSAVKAISMLPQAVLSVLGLGIPLALVLHILQQLDPVRFNTLQRQPRPQILTTTGSGFTLSTSKGTCGLDSSNTFVCASGTTAATFQAVSGKLAYVGSDSKTTSTFGAAATPTGSTQQKVYATPSSVAVSFTWQSV